MTEAEWLAATDPTPMLEFLNGKASGRKLRILAVACCRRLEAILVAETLKALSIAELYAEGLADSTTRKQAREMAFHSPWCPDKSTAHRRGPAKACVAACLARRPYEAATRAEGLARRIGMSETKFDASAYEQTSLGPRLKSSELAKAQNRRAELHAGLVRDIFGNPFRPVSFNPSWHTSTVIALAQGIYEDRAFDRMPILADALQDANCDNEEILDHCRQRGEHTRGCWVVDLLLEKN